MKDLLKSCLSWDIHFDVHEQIEKMFTYVFQVSRVVFVRELLAIQIIARNKHDTFLRCLLTNLGLRNKIVIRCEMSRVVKNISPSQVCVKKSFYCST